MDIDKPKRGRPRKIKVIDKPLDIRTFLILVND